MKELLEKLSEIPLRIEVVNGRNKVICSETYKANRSSIEISAGTKVELFKQNYALYVRVNDENVYMVSKFDNEEEFLIDLNKEFNRKADIVIKEYLDDKYFDKIFMNSSSSSSYSLDYLVGRTEECLEVLRKKYYQRIKFDNEIGLVLEYIK